MGPAASPRCPHPHLLTLNLAGFLKSTQPCTFLSISKRLNAGLVLPEIHCHTFLQPLSFKVESCAPSPELPEHKPEHLRQPIRWVCFPSRPQASQDRMVIYANSVFPSPGLLVSGTRVPRRKPLEGSELLFSKGTACSSPETKA
jgi:hypothetical protein